MFDWVLISPLRVLVGKISRWKKIQKVINFKVETSGKKVVIIFRGIFRTQSNIYDGAFVGK